jgi:hypothetical protein
MNWLSLLDAKALYAEAEPLMARVVTILEKSLGENHPTLATALNNLAQLLKATNRLTEADPLMRRAVKIYRRFRETTGHEHPHMQQVIRNYSALLSDMHIGPDEIQRRVQTLLEE